MKKYLNLIIIFIFLLLSTGCSDNKVEINLSDTEKLKMFNYQESNSITKNIELTNFKMEIPSNGDVGSFCIYNNTIFYAVDFFNYYDNPTGEQNILDFEKEYNTQIRSYNLEDKTNLLLYQYNEKKCIQVTDMQCNGNELVWEDYSNENTWNIKKITLNNISTPKNIISYDEKKGEMTSITLTITKDSLFWYEQSNDVNNFINLCKYDFKTEKISIEKSGLTLSSPYEHVNIANDTCTTYETTNNNQTLIHINNLNTTNDFEINLTGTVSNPISNGEICIWMNSSDYQDKGSLFIYDISERTVEKIDASYIFSYGIVNDIVLVNQKDGLHLYDTKNKTYKNIFKTEEVSYGYTFQGQQNNVYTQKHEKDLHVINLTFRKE